MSKTINILGTEYIMRESCEREDSRLIGKDGFCDTSTKECVVEKMDHVEPDAKNNLLDYKNTVKRHEVIHAFLYESGLSDCSWGSNEAMVDWLAIQFPKMAKAFKELNIDR